MRIEEFKNFYYFEKGQIYFSKFNNMQKTFHAEVIFAEKDGLFHCIKNRYGYFAGGIEVAFVTRKGFIDFVQALYDSVPDIYTFNGLTFVSQESTYNVSEDSPIHLIKRRTYPWQNPL